MSDNRPTRTEETEAPVEARKSMSCFAFRCNRHGYGRAAEFAALGLGRIDQRGRNAAAPRLGHHIQVADLSEASPLDVEHSRDRDDSDGYAVEPRQSNPMMRVGLQSPGVDGDCFPRAGKSFLVKNRDSKAVAKPVSGSLTSRTMQFISFTRVLPHQKIPFAARVPSRCPRAYDRPALPRFRTAVGDQVSCFVGLLRTAAPI